MPKLMEGEPLPPTNKMDYLIDSANSLRCPGGERCVRFDDEPRPRSSSPGAAIFPGQDLWPGFDPTEIPLEIYDETDTLLAGHLNVPEGFVPVGSREDSPLGFAGRHPQVVANTCVEIVGTLVTTLVVDDEDTDLDGAAAIANHESFHVFQFRRRDEWQPGNEAVAFLYPVTDAGLRALRRREVGALRRALVAEDRSQKVGWVRQAMSIRTERFARMEDDCAAYERGTELMEGTAFYVEALVEGRPGMPLPVMGFGPVPLRPLFDGVRKVEYVSDTDFTVEQLPDGSLVISGASLKATLPHASFAEEGATMWVRLQPEEECKTGTS